MMIFVYGTLRRGEANHGTLLGARYLGPGLLRGKYRMVDLGYYPGVVDAEAYPDATIAGEVFEVDAATLARVDRLEGHPTFYRRRAVRLSCGRDVETYIYPAGSAAGYPILTTGDWLDRSSLCIST